MADIAELMNSGQKPKFSWSKPEGWFGIGIIAGIVSLIGYGLYKILPFVLTILQQGIAAIILGVVFLFLIAVVTNKRFILAVRQMIESVARRLQRAVIRYDPVAAARSFIIRTEEKLRDIQIGLEKLSGFIRKAKDKLAKTQDEYDASMKRASVAKEHGQKVEVVLNVRKAGRREKRTVSLKEQIERLIHLYEIFKKYQQALQLLHDDTVDEVEQVSEEWEQMKAGHSLMRSMASIISPDSSEREMFQDAMQFMMDDKSMKLGEIEGFFDMTQSVIGSMDLDNLVMEESGLQALEAWEKKMNDVLLSPEEKRALLPSSSGFSDVLLKEGRRIPASAELRRITPPTSFGDLLKGKEEEK